jgi:hypothetical protein
MQRNKLFQLSREEALGRGRQQVSKFVDRASSRAVPAGHAWHPFDAVVGKSERSGGSRPGRGMLCDRNEMIVIGDHTIAVEEV